VEVLRDKTGSDAQPKEFNRMLRRVIEADQLPDYAMELAETTDRVRLSSSDAGVRPRRWRWQRRCAEEERCALRRRSPAHAEVDARMDQLAGRR
jgi:hypothetical protein